MMVINLLVQDRRAPYARKPDYWMLSEDAFTSEELAPFTVTLAKLRIFLLPESTTFRSGQIFDKDEVLSIIAEHQEHYARKTSKPTG